MSRAIALALLPAALLLASCSATRWESTPPAQQSSQAQLPPSSGPKAPLSSDMTRSKRGNPPFYEVFGVRYSVMEHSQNYREEGVASWYGKKFHGRLTSSGERYDMHRMTAAHKTLPLPTNVRVTNLSNGRSVIVRVNDRGPFVKNRLIDMSYAAALELDMVMDGTAPVEVVALDTGYTGAITTVAATTQPDTAAAAIPSLPASGPRMYVQVGAFGEAGNAQNLASRLTQEGIGGVSVRAPAAGEDAVYRVRIGPFSDVSEYDRIVGQVETLQIAAPHLVVEDDVMASNQ